jgi:hypothetical protein
VELLFDAVWHRIFLPPHPSFKTRFVRTKSHLPLPRTFSIHISFFSISLVCDCRNHGCKPTSNQLIVSWSACHMCQSTSVAAHDFAALQMQRHVKMRRTSLRRRPATTTYAWLCIDVFSQFSKRYNCQPGYMMTLSQELANEASQPHVRNAASLAMKNALTARVSQYHVALFSISTSRFDAVGCD